VEGSLVLDEKGHLHLPSLEKAVPEEVERLKKRVYALLPHLPLADLLLEVDNWTGFLRHFTHLTSGDALVGQQKLELVAALMDMGMNLGLEKMAESCPYTYRQLSWSIDWHIREETLLAALANLDNFVLAAPLSSAWGDGSTSSSDGMRIHVGVNAASAEYNAKYFHARRGTNMYIHAADIWVPFGKPQIIGTNEEALYVIDALCHHESDLHIYGLSHESDCDTAQTRGRYPRSHCGPYCAAGMGAHSLDRRLSFCSTVRAFSGKPSPFAPVRGGRERLRRRGNSSSKRPFSLLSSIKRDAFIHLLC